MTDLAKTKKGMTRKKNPFGKLAMFQSGRSFSIDRVAARLLESVMGLRSRLSTVIVFD